jgi:hypothetical protein
MKKSIILRLILVLSRGRAACTETVVAEPQQKDADRSTLCDNSDLFVQTCEEKKETKRARKNPKKKGDAHRKFEENSMSKEEKSVPQAPVAP